MVKGEYEYEWQDPATSSTSKPKEDKGKEVEKKKISANESMHSSTLTYTQSIIKNMSRWPDGKQQEILVVQQLNSLQNELTTELAIELCKKNSSKKNI